MHTRFESDMAEIAADGSYLMICADRKMVFLEGAEASKHPFAEVESIGSDDSGLVVRLENGKSMPCPLPPMTAVERDELAARLNGCLVRWR